MMALVGPSGSGKSTVARLIASFWNAGSGTVKIGGVNIQIKFLFLKMEELCKEENIRS